MEVPIPSLRPLWMLRLGLGSVILVASLTCFLGTGWDIQWHSLIGRDRILIPPHEMMLGGVALSGVAATADIVLETIWAHRSPLLAERMVAFAGLFRGSLGGYVAGFAALDAAVAFPLDAYWHALYGIDVTIWAPFHVMILGGMATTAMGGAYVLASAARLAVQQGVPGAARLGYVGAVAAFAAAFDIFMLLTLNALQPEEMIDLGGLTIDLFPPLATLLSASIFVLAAQVVPWRWAATAVVLASLVFVAAMAAFVPPATDLLVRAEHQQFREPNPGIALVAFMWPLMPVLAAIAVDVVRRRVRGVRRWSLMLLAVCCLLACVPVIPIRPLQGVETLSEVFVEFGAASATASLLLGLTGALWGAWLGRQAGLALASAEVAG